ncbi:MAG: hypothetical protein ACLGIF_02850 [Actinomycetes bacterium]
MASSRPLSPAARARQRRGYLAGGLFLSGVWLLVTVAIGVTGGVRAAAGSQLLLVIFSAPALILVALGLLAERSARQFDAADQAFADALDAALDRLAAEPRAAVYPAAGEVVGTAGPLTGQRVDPVTAGEVAERLETLLGRFPVGLRDAYGAPPVPRRPGRPEPGAAGAVMDLLEGPYKISGGSREHLAEASVITVEPAEGGAPILWVKLPTGAVEGWLRDLLDRVGSRLGGGTHASVTLMARRADLVAALGPDPDPADGPPATAATRVRVVLRGPLVGSDLALPSTAQVDGEDRRLLPTGFPERLGQALGEAARQVAGPGGS